MEKLRELTEREMEVLRQAQKNGWKALSLPALAKHKAKLRKDLEDPLISNADRLRIEKELASIETAEQNLSAWEAKQARTRPSNWWRRWRRQ